MLLGLAHARLQVREQSSSSFADFLSLARKLFLTLLGGGVFANDTRSLIRVISETHLMYGAGLEVTVSHNCFVLVFKSGEKGDHVFPDPSV